MQIIDCPVSFRIVSSNKIAVLWWLKSYSNKDHVEEMKRVNDEKLAELNAKLEDCESTLKSHRREFSVSDSFQ